MARILMCIALALSLGGCGVTAVVGATASVVGAAVDVTGSVVSGTVDVVSSGVSGAIDLATDDDHEKDTKTKQAADASTEAPAAIATEPVSAPSN